MKNLNGINRYNANGYILVGDQLIYNPLFSNFKDKSSKRKFKVNNLSVDLHSGISPKLTEFHKYPKEYRESHRRIFSLNKMFSSKNSRKQKVYGCTSLNQRNQNENKILFSDYDQFIDFNMKFQRVPSHN